MIRIKTGARNAAAQVIAVHAAEQRCVDDVLGGAVDEHLLVFRRSVALIGGDETRPQVGQIRAQCSRRQHIGAAAHRAG